MTNSHTSHTSSIYFDKSNKQTTKNKKRSIGRLSKVFLVHTKNSVLEPSSVLYFTRCEKSLLEVTSGHECSVHLHKVLNRIMLVSHSKKYSMFYIHCNNHRKFLPHKTSALADVAIPACPQDNHHFWEAKPHHRFVFRLGGNWLIDWLTDWLIDQLIDWLSDWLTTFISIEEIDPALLFWVLGQKVHLYSQPPHQKAEAYLLESLSARCWPRRRAVSSAAPLSLSYCLSLHQTGKPGCKPLEYSQNLPITTTTKNVKTGPSRKVIPNTGGS